MFPYIATQTINEGKSDFNSIQKNQLNLLNTI